MNPSGEKSKLSWNQTCNIHNAEILKDVKHFKLWKWKKKKKALYLSVNVLIGDTIFTSPNGDGTVILRGHPSHAKV